MTDLVLGVPFWATAKPTPDGIRYRRNFDYMPMEEDMLTPLGKTVREFIERSHEYPKVQSLIGIVEEDLAGESEVILKIDDQTWKDQGFWPKSDWYPVA